MTSPKSTRKKRDGRPPLSGRAPSLRSLMPDTPQQSTVKMKKTKSPASGGKGSNKDKKSRIVIAPPTPSQKLKWSKKMGPRKVPTYDTIERIRNLLDEGKTGKIKVKSSSSTPRQVIKDYSKPFEAHRALKLDSKHSICHHGRPTVPSDHPFLQEALDYIMKQRCPFPNYLLAYLEANNNNKTAKEYTTRIVREMVYEEYDISKEVVSDEMILSYINRVGKESSSANVASSPSTEKNVSNTNDLSTLKDRVGQNTNDLSTTKGLLGEMAQGQLAMQQTVAEGQKQLAEGQKQQQQVQAALQQNVADMQMQQMSINAGLQPKIHDQEKVNNTLFERTDTLESMVKNMDFNQRGFEKKFEKLMAQMKAEQAGDTTAAIRAMDASSGSEYDDEDDEDEQSKNTIARRSLFPAASTASSKKGPPQLPSLSNATTGSTSPFGEPQFAMSMSRHIRKERFGENAINYSSAGTKTTGLKEFEDEAMPSYEFTGKPDSGSGTTQIAGLKHVDDDDS